MRKVKIAYSVIALLIIALSMRAETLEVCGSCDYLTLRSAIASASPGDVIRLHAGEYIEEDLVVDKSLTIQGVGMPIVRGTRSSEILIIDADHVTVEGIIFKNAGFSHIQDLAAIRVRKRDHFIIRNNHIIDASFGIYVENGRDGLIEKNTLTSNARDEMTSGNAIHCWYASHLIIRQNNIRQYRDGIYLEFVHESEISGNRSEGNVRYGLHFMFSNDDSYSDNIFRENGAGVAVMFSKRIRMHRNVFQRNWGRASYGLLLKEIYDADIRYNSFEENTVGILVEGSARLQYSDNNFRQNGWAVQMSGGCLDNDFSRNNFIANTMDLVVNGNINNNTFDGNYWGDYSGYDLDRDGIGEVPHRPVKLFSYILGRSPESIILLRSFFIDLLNFAEKVSPVFTPAEVQDKSPLMRPVS